MSCLTAEIAEAVRAALAAGTFCAAFAPVRRWAVSWKLPELAVLRVAVVPGPLTQETMTRSADRIARGVDIVIQQRIAPETLAEGDALVELVEQFFEFFRAKEVTTASERKAVCTGRQMLDPQKSVIDPRLLEDLRTMTLVIRTDWLARQ